MAAAASAGGAVPPEHREWVERLRHGGSTPLSHDSHQTVPNSWTCPPCHVFSVRGPDYMQTKAKIPAIECLLQPLTFEYVQGPRQISHIMNHPHSRVRAALDAASHASSSQNRPFVWAFNIQLGNKAHHSLVFYFVSFSSPPEGSLMQRFLDGDDAFRNARLKLVTRLLEAPWLVQAVVGERWPVCVIGRVVTCTYTREKHYIELDADSGSSIISRTAISLTFHLFPLVVADLAFVLEGIHPDELPERILGAMRVNKLHASSASYMDMSEATTQSDVIIHKNTVSKGIKAMFTKSAGSSAKDLHAGLKQTTHGSGDKKAQGRDQRL